MSKPIHVTFNKLGYLLEETYILHPVEWYVCGRYDKEERREEILPLSPSEFQYLSQKYNLKYSHNKSPSTYWKQSQNIKNLQKFSTFLRTLSDAQLLTLARKNAIIVGSLPREEYIKIITRDPEIPFYPACNSQKLTADNYTDWIYYETYNCWIDKLSERCTCVMCNPLRSEDEYSVLNLKNNHSVWCTCEQCMCINSQIERVLHNKK